MTASDGQCLKRMPRRRSRRFEETIQSIAGLRAEHHANATQHRRVVDRITSLMGSATLHRGADSLRCRLGEFERPRRGPWLSRARPASLCMAGGRSVAGVPLLVILILTTQRGDDRLTQRRELLNLELTILSEQKTKGWSRRSSSFGRTARTSAIGSMNWPRRCPNQRTLNR
jgi:hypothetical protein